MQMPFTFVADLISFISLLQISVHMLFISLCKFTPRYFILFDTIFKEIIFLISFLYTTWLVNRKGTGFLCWFCILELYWIYFLVFLLLLLAFHWGFLHLCLSRILACSFLFLWYLCLDFISGSASLISTFGNIPSFQNFGSLRLMLVFKYFIEFTSENIWSWTFYGKTFLTTNLNFWLIIGLFIFAISS